MATNQSTEDLLTKIFGVPARDMLKDTRTYRQRRAQCEQDGHKYQVHGKKNPFKVSCSRCSVSWAVGARTEPEEAG